MISLGELPPPISGSETDPSHLRLWFLTTLEHHRKESNANMQTQLASFEAAVLQHLSHLKEELLVISRERKTSKTALSTPQSEDDDGKRPSEFEHNKSFKSMATDDKNAFIHEQVASLEGGTAETMTQESEHSTHTHEAAWEEFCKIDVSAFGSIWTSPLFDLVVAFAIISSAVVMLVELQWYEFEAKVALGMIREDTWGNGAKYFNVLEHTFNVIFLIELAARLIHFKLRFFRDVFSLIDLALIISSSVNLYILQPLGVNFANLSMFRLIRLTRLVRVLRFLRVMRLCAELRVLVNTCVACIQALVWSMIFLGVIMLSCALFMTQLLHESIIDPSLDFGTRQWIYRYYGSSFRSIYTLFEITLAGCWPTYFRPLVENVSPLYGILAFFYISMIVFALIRIITALFLKETLRVASTDSQSMLNEQTKNKKANLKKLGKLFQAMDVHHNGKISSFDFHRVVTHPMIQGLLQGVGMELHDIEMLFRLLDNGDGVITYDEFVQGVSRLKGTAREIDVIAILHSEDKVRGMLTTLLCQMEQLLDRVADA